MNNFLDRCFPMLYLSESRFQNWTGNGYFRINKASENGGQENYSQLVSFESSQQLFAERQDGAGPGPTPGGLPFSEFSSCTPPAVAAIIIFSMPIGTQCRANWHTSPIHNKLYPLPRGALYLVIIKEFRLAAG